MDRSYVVYKHTCPNGKVYVGITGQPLNKRWNWGSGYAYQFFGKAVRKYGWGNIRHEILEEGLTLEEANDAEKRYIAEYNSNNPEHGYNCTDGGEGVCGRIATPEEREANRAVMNRLWADPEKREMFLAHLRELNRNRIGKPMPEEAKRKSALARGKAVDQYTISGDFVATYQTLMDAARAVKQKSNSSISSCCQWKEVTAHGFLWRYHGEPLDYERYLARRAEWKASMLENGRRSAERNSIPVSMLDADGNVIATFPSAKAAKRATGAGDVQILKVCRGNATIAGGHRWKFATT